jgi:DNA polymerase III gamma/tau subunit
MIEEQELHLKYRPRKWSEVVGQGAAITTLQQVIENKKARSFLLIGESGIGKTTIARIACRAMGCNRGDEIEVNASDYTGIDDMRKIQELVLYKPFGKSKLRGIILDECHQLSQPAWQMLLKPIEEPPEHVAWFFCTTNPQKIPPTVKTRCMTLSLDLVGLKELGELCDSVCKQEGIKLPSGVHDLVVHEANGSPRQMLVNLGLCRYAVDRKAAARALARALESEPIIQLCRMLSNGNGNWKKAMTFINQLDERERNQPESIRFIIVNYMAKALADAQSDRQVTHYLTILEQFSQPYNPAEKFAPLLLSVGRVLYNGNGGEE